MIPGLLSFPTSCFPSFSPTAATSLGAIRVRSALLALGVDQFSQKDPEESKVLATYFNFLLLSSTLGATIGVTIFVWVATNRHWWPGFLISLLATFVGFIFLVLGRPFYRLQAPGDSPLLRVIQMDENLLEHTQEQCSYTSTSH